MGLRPTQVDEKHANPSLLGVVLGHDLQAAEELCASPEGTAENSPGRQSHKR